MLEAQFPNDTIGEIGRQAAETLPRILLALAIVAAGWLVARLLRSVTAKVFDTWARKLTPRLTKLAGGGDAEARIARTTTGKSASRAAQTLVFWVVFLIFVTIAADALALDVISRWLTGVVGFLPRLIGAAFVLLLGILIGSAARTAATAAAGRAGFTYPNLLGQSARAGVILVSAIVAFDQIGLEIAVLIVMVGVISAAMLGGAALAFGLGARDSVSNILAAHYLMRTFKVGHHVRIGEIEGKILEITPTAVIIDSGPGRAVIPASQFNDQVATLLSK